MDPGALARACIHAYALFSVEKAIHACAFARVFVLERLEGVAVARARVCVLGCVWVCLGVFGCALVFMSGEGQVHMP